LFDRLKKYEFATGLDDAHGEPGAIAATPITGLSLGAYWS